MLRTTIKSKICTHEGACKPLHFLKRKITAQYSITPRETSAATVAVPNSHMKSRHVFTSIKTNIKIIVGVKSGQSNFI